MPVKAAEEEMVAKRKREVPIKRAEAARKRETSVSPSQQERTAQSARMYLTLTWCFARNVGKNAGGKQENEEQNVPTIAHLRPRAGASIKAAPKRVAVTPA